MKIALTQFETVWENIPESMKLAESYIQEALEQKADVLVFPEFSFTGFSLTPKAFGETPDNQHTRDFFKKKSLETGLTFVFGYIENVEGANPRNKLAIVKDGEILLDYAKMHSYSFGHENDFYSTGKEIFNAKIGDVEVGAHICFDLRFPEIFQYSKHKAEVIFVIGNWPGDRLENWYTLLRARSLETQCYIAGCNRAGAGGGVNYAPSSVAFDPAGVRVTEPSDGKIVCFDVSKEWVEKVRKSFPLSMDRRDSLYAELYSKV